LLIAKNPNPSPSGPKLILKRIKDSGEQVTLPGTSRIYWDKYAKQPKIFEIKTGIAVQKKKALPNIFGEETWQMPVSINVKARSLAGKHVCTRESPCGDHLR